MGGGTVLRSAAAKVASIGSVNAGLRGVPASSTVGQSLVRKVAGAPSAVLSAQGGCEEAVSPASVQWDRWSIDDWEEVVSVVEEGSREPMPRVVFGVAPSFEEAKAATSELKDAIDEVYLSKAKDPIPDGVSPVGSPLASGTITTHAVPNHAVQAFKLLSQSPAAQDVVASIASDPTVWNAFLQNEALKDFMRAQGMQFPLMDLNPEESIDEAAYEGWKSPGKLEELSNDSDSDNHENGFITVLQNVKVTIVEMVSGISIFLQNIFPPPAAEKAPGNDSNTGSTTNERTMGASFMGLAVLVIMVILLKRV